MTDRLHRVLTLLFSCLAEVEYQQDYAFDRVMFTDNVMRVTYFSGFNIFTRDIYFDCDDMNALLDEINEYRPKESFWERTVLQYPHLLVLKHMWERRKTIDEILADL